MEGYPNVRMPYFVKVGDRILTRDEYRAERASLKAKLREVDRDFSGRRSPNVQGGRPESNRRSTSRLPSRRGCTMRVNYAGEPHFPNRNDLEEPFSRF